MASSIRTESDASSTTSSTNSSIRPNHPFYSLPPELIFDIVDLLPVESFINFTFANYPLLRHNGLAPSLSQSRVGYITNQARIPICPLTRLPVETMLNVIGHLKPLDMMRFVFANYQDLARRDIAPPLTSETILQLQNAIGSELGAG